MVALYKYLIKILTFCIFVLNSLFILVIASSTVKGNDNAVLLGVLKVTGDED